jgi:adenylate cyclase
MSTQLFRVDNTLQVQQMSANAAEAFANQTREILDGYFEKIRLFGTLMLWAPIYSPKKTGPEADLFRQDRDFLALFVLTQEGKTLKGLSRMVSPALEAALQDPQGDRLFARMTEEKELDGALLSRGETIIFPVAITPEIRALAIALPFFKAPGQKDFTHYLLGLVRPERMAAPFENSVFTGYVVNHQGLVLAHSLAAIRPGFDLNYLPAIKQMLGGQYHNGQLTYQHPDQHEPYLASYHLVGTGGVGVVAEVPAGKAFQIIQRVSYRAVLICTVVFSVAMVVLYLFSETLVRPLRQLVAAAKRIARGDFETRVTIRTRDEVSVLAHAFNEMAEDLKEMDKMKAILQKFHSPEITEKLMSGEIKLGGERREVTIVFTDIRGFTMMSESQSPEQVVEMLNEYFTQMVRQIRSCGGVVDKYIGDAIMALWGIAIDRPDDTHRAVEACLRMREQLEVLNMMRRERGDPELKIGMGISVGEVIAGNIGSEEQLEYTVIGDATNVASRIESATKQLHTDLLIDLSVYERVKDSFVCEPMGSISLRGKSIEAKLFAVRSRLKTVDVSPALPAAPPPLKKVA